MLSKVLDEIISHKRLEVARKQAELAIEALREQAFAMPPPRHFVGSLRYNIAQGKAAVIAEIKKASPSKGVIREDFSPVDIAKDYAVHGASCLSILTDSHYFQGSASYLTAVRQTCSLPLLRKDFIIDPYQVYEASVMGADCILLIAAVLSLDEMLALECLAQSLGMAVLVEVHNAEELKQAVQLETPLLGINNRNLQTFEVSLETTLSLLAHIPPKLRPYKLIVSESGIATPEDVARLRAQDVHAFLVGETFMRQPSPGQALRNLFGDLT